MRKLGIDRYRFKIVIACGPPTVPARAIPFSIPEVFEAYAELFGECRNYGPDQRAK